MEKVKALNHVLAVEDSPTQAEVLRSNLSAAGFEVSLARDGAEALQCLAKGDFDIVVSDVVMPVMDGYQLCQAVKDSPATVHLPVILLTSLTDPLEVVKGLESGADNFLRKPYQPEQLVARIRSALKNRELRSTGEEETGIRLSFMDREFEIDADRSQILDLLVSTFQELVVASRDVRTREAELMQAHVELQRHHDAVDLERNRLQAVMDSVPVPLFVVGPTGDVSHVCEAAATTLGATVDEICGRRLDDVVSFVDSTGTAIATELLPHHRAQELGEPARAGAAFDVFLAHSDGTRLPVVLEASPIFDDRGRPAGCVGIAHVLGALTQHDSVTGLPNNVAYLERAAVLLTGPGGNAAMLRLEVDRFDVIRAALGHESTNQILVEVARRLRQVFEPTQGTASRSECFLAYLGGNQFGVLLGNLPGSFSVLQMAEAARRAVAGCEPAQDGLRLTASVGVALADGGHDSTQLFAAANEALRRARESGGDHVELFRAPGQPGGAGPAPARGRPPHRGGAGPRGAALPAGGGPGHR
jgi:diguanylate cyclase (GGDEF)-like protein/PAS domain S-box-containing protein